jgi:hypothetical protein
MSPGQSTSTLRQLLEEGLSRLLPELEARLEAEASDRWNAARRIVAEHLNQAVRLCRTAGGFANTAAVLAEASAPFCRGLAVFRVSTAAVRGERIRGVREDAAECFAALELPVSAVASLGPALDAGDPVIALANEGEIFAAMVELQAHPRGERVCVVPIMTGATAAGFLYAWGEVEASALELIAQAAGLALSAAAVPPAAGLIAIGPAPNAAPELPAPVVPDQVHLRARRFARVQVAEIRLYRADLVAAGRNRRDLYTVLREPLDAARDAYRRRFMGSAGMVDYLHEELLHTLANDDVALLGPQYPGALV